MKEKILEAFRDLGFKLEEEAAKWFRKAAKLGNADAMYCLGMCYGRGEGLKENFVEAERWLKKAAMQGHQQAREMLFKMWGA